jgi:hypothetical protein
MGEGVPLLLFCGTCCLTGTCEQGSNKSWLNLHEHIPQRDIRKMIYAKLSKLDRIMVEAAHISKQKVKLDTQLASDCAREGHVTLLQWAREHGWPWDTYESTRCRFAARNGRWDVVKWAIENGCPFGRR